MVTKSLINNIENSEAISIMDKSEFRNLIEQKTEKVSKELNSISRITEKTLEKLENIFEENIFISIATNWGGHSPGHLREIKNNSNEFINTIYHRHTMRNFSEEYQRWHKELMNESIFREIDAYWTNEDKENLHLICRTYTDALYPATHFFKYVFKNDERYNLLVKYYKKRLNNEEELYRGQLDSKIEIEFILQYVDIKRLQYEIPFGLALKKCKLTGINYIEHYHYGKYALNHLYLPYYEYISGWHDYHSDLKYKINSQMTEDESIKVLTEFCDNIEGIPSVKDFNNPVYTPQNIQKIHDTWVKCPYSDYYNEKFGDFRAALLKANKITELAANSKYGIMCLAKDGHFCRSMAEQKIDNWLYNNNIQHEMEPPYPKHDEYNKSGRMRADWKVNNDYVEYFGLPTEKKYAEKMTKKRNLASALGIKLIEIFQDDLNDLDENLNRLFK